MEAINRDKLFWETVMKVPEPERSQAIHHQKNFKEYAKKQREQEKKRSEDEARLDAKLKEQPYIEELPLDGISPLGRKIIIEDRERRKRRT